MFVMPHRKKVITPSGLTPPPYVYGKFATNGKGNLNSGGPVLALTGGTPSGEFLYGGDLEFPLAAVFGPNTGKYWAYIRIKYLYPLSPAPEAHRYGLWTKRYYSGSVAVRVGARKTSSGINYLIDTVPAGDLLYDELPPWPGNVGLETVTAIVKPDTDANLITTLVSTNGTSWNHIWTDIAYGPFESGFNFELLHQNVNAPPIPLDLTSLAEWGFGAGIEYTAQEELDILQNGLLAATGLG